MNEGTTAAQVDKDYKLEEYKRLTSEVQAQLDRLDRLDDRVTQIAGFCASVAVVLAGLGNLTTTVLVQLLGAAVALYLCPILLGFVAAKREKIDLRIAQINYHLRYYHEERYLAGEGWETIRHHLFKTRPWFAHKGEVYHALAPRRGLDILASRGIFVSIEGLYILAASGCAMMALSHHPPLPALIFVGLLCAISLFALFLSWGIIEHRRHREEATEVCHQPGTDGKSGDAAHPRQHLEDTRD
jgi:Flp pilus assembly protein TadB